MTIKQLNDGVKVNWMQVTIIEKVTTTKYIVADGTELEGFSAAGIAQLAPDSSQMEEWAVKINTMRSTHAENLIAALARPLNV